MTKAAAKTGMGPTISVAVEQYYPQDQRIVNDALAYPILPLTAKAFVWLLRPGWARSWLMDVSDRVSPGIWGGVLCRKRYIDDKLVQSAGEIGAVVNLGAGSDTRAFRLPALAGIPVWEVDQPENIEAKRARLHKLLGRIPAHVTLVSTDFDREDLGAVLAANGYSSDQRTFFIAEAVTQYLSAAGIRKTFQFLASAASGSYLAFTYIRNDFLEGQALYDQEAVYKRYVMRDKSWLFALDPEAVADFLGEFGWGVAEHVGYEELAECYVKPTGRVLASTAIERMVYAQKE